MIVQANPGQLIDDQTLRKKIDVLFDNVATQSQPTTPKGRLGAIDAKNDIMQICLKLDCATIGKLMLSNN